MNFDVGDGINIPRVSREVIEPELHFSALAAKLEIPSFQPFDVKLASHPRLLVRSIVMIVVAGWFFVEATRLRRATNDEGREPFRSVGVDRESEGDASLIHLDTISTVPSKARRRTHSVEETGFVHVEDITWVVLVRKIDDSFALLFERFRIDLLAFAMELVRAKIVSRFTKRKFRQCRTADWNKDHASTFS